MVALLEGGDCMEDKNLRKKAEKAGGTASYQPYGSFIMWGVVKGGDRTHSHSKEEF